MAPLHRATVSKAAKAAVAIGFTVCALAIGWLLALRFLPWDILYLSQIREGKELIARIEAFKNYHGRLPDPAYVHEVLKLGFELRTGYYPDYRVSGGNYEIWYAFGFDGPTIEYWSGSGKWYCELCE